VKWPNWQKVLPGWVISRQTWTTLERSFAQGFKPDLRTISRLHTLSSQLQYFFAGHINHICDQFVVYSDLCPACMPGAEKIVVETPEEEGETEQKIDLL